MTPDDPSTGGDDQDALAAEWAAALAESGAGVHVSDGRQVPVSFRSAVLGGLTCRPDGAPDEDLADACLTLPNSTSDGVRPDGDFHPRDRKGVARRGGR